MTNSEDPCRQTLQNQLRRVLEHPQYPNFSRASTITPEMLEAGYRIGILRKTDLQDGRYYFGRCRNAQVARWDTARSRFTYMRTKFGNSYPEDICAPEDDNGFDVFEAVAECQPEPHEVIT